MDGGERDAAQTVLKANNAFTLTHLPPTPPPTTTCLAQKAKLLAGQR